MVIIKGLMAAALAVLGVAAVYTGDAGAGTDSAQAAYASPNAGLPALFRPMEH